MLIREQGAEPAATGKAGGGPSHRGGLGGTPQARPASHSQHPTPSARGPWSTSRSALWLSRRIRLRPCWSRTTQPLYPPGRQSSQFKWVTLTLTTPSVPWVNLITSGCTSRSGNPVRRNSPSNVNQGERCGHQLLLARDTVSRLATCSFRPATHVSKGWWLPFSDQYYNPSWGLYIHLSRLLQFYPLPNPPPKLQWEEPPETHIWPHHFPALSHQCLEIIVFRNKWAKNPKDRVYAAFFHSMTSSSFLLYRFIL